MQNCSFNWSSHDPFLKNLNFTAYSGELIMVIGDTGSGKSSFLSALNGMHKSYLACNNF